MCLSSTTPRGEPDDVVGTFATDGYTDAGEAAALSAVSDRRRGDVLDIGIGGGRTTGLLRPAARSYVGLDISREMLALARERFPEADLRDGDAVGLAGLPHDAFDLVIFSYNGLDALDHVGARPHWRPWRGCCDPKVGSCSPASTSTASASTSGRCAWPVARCSPRLRYHLALAARHPGSMVRSVQQLPAEPARGAGRPRLGDATPAGARVPVRRPLRDPGGDGRRGQAAGLEVVAAYADDGTALAPARRTPTPTTCTSSAAGRHLAHRRLWQAGGMDDRPAAPDPARRELGARAVRGRAPGRPRVRARPRPLPAGPVRARRSSTAW